MNYYGVLLRSLEKEDVEKVLREIHDSPTGGHFAREFISHKILRAWYYWPTFFKYAHAHVRKCNFFQLSVGKYKKASIPLQLVTISIPFEKWIVYVIEEINPNLSKQHKYILSENNYFMRWSKVIPLTHINEKVVIQFLEEHKITRSVVPSFLVFYNTVYFYSTILNEFSLEKGIILRYSTKYYP